MNTPTESIATVSIATLPMPAEIKTIRRVAAVAWAVVAAVGGLVAGIAAELPILTVAAVPVAASALLLRLWVINMAFDRWRWGIDERWIERRSGVFVHRTQIVPRSRVQTVTTRTGPIDRRLGLSSIVIHTAGTRTPSLTVPHLEQDAADRLRVELGA